MLSLPNILEYTLTFFFLYATVFFMLIAIKHRNELEKKPALGKKRPFITIIIPAYNEEKTIKDCVTTVLKSNYPKDKLEVIVVDDGSTDKTYEKTKEIQDSRLKILTKTNSGKASSINFGIDQSKGEIIATLDADSYVTPDAILNMIPYFDEDGVAAVTAAVKVKQKSNNNLLRDMQRLEYIFIIFTRKILNFVDAVPVTPGPLSMFKREIFDKIGKFDEKNIMEDQEIALRIQSYNYKIKSSMDAEVYTDVPENFSELLKQRVRWHRGGLRNNIKYMHMISPVYGDFGLMMMPMTFIAIIALVGVFLISFLYYTSSSFYYFQKLGAKGFLLSLSPLHFIAGVLFIINILWIIWGLTIFKKEKISIAQVFIYMIAYFYLVTIYWAVALYKELRAQKLTW